MVVCKYICKLDMKVTLAIMFLMGKGFIGILKVIRIMGNG